MNGRDLHLPVPVPVPDKSDPVWTAARGFAVREAEGTPKLLNGGNEAARGKVTGERTGGRLSLMELGVAPGFGNQPHAHGAEDEALYVTSGVFRLLNGNQIFEAGPGDFVYIPRGTRHGFRILATETASLMVFYTSREPSSSSSGTVTNPTRPETRHRSGRRRGDRGRPGGHGRRRTARAERPPPRWPGEATAAVRIRCPSRACRVGPRRILAAP
ncbi:cupin domain-containing protein [Streptomyces sp. MNU89]|uniref:cupin domain-containing protein n=1 Tax=Streptomyces sp. MNU89 TaxID=2560025 RepID=UPI001E4606FE|nr:cupin domain-containing protein [Streptomyces sp. MNU89]MCC9740383.1 cupin domain-containing protein [Streptomyces sp. MNU89]